MGISFRAINHNDAASYNGQVMSSNGVDYDLPDYNGFLGDGFIRSDAAAHVRRYMPLEAPVFNHVLGGPGCGLLGMLLGVQSTLWKEIVDMRVALDVETGEYIPSDELEYSRKYLYGGQIAKHLIEELDIQATLDDLILKGIYASFVKGGKNINDFVDIYHSGPRPRKDGDIQLVDGYWAHVDDEDMEEFQKCLKVPVSVLHKEYGNKFFASRKTRYSYLKNMPRDKSSLYGMLTEGIVVLPYEMRPKIDDRKHKLTNHYDLVLTASNELATNRNSEPRILMSKYRALEFEVRKLQYKAQVARNVEKDDLAVLERIKSKNGQIRMNNLGKRQDYSGRAVVCINPFLPVDVIRIPKVMIPKLLEFHVLPYLKDKLAEAKQNDDGTKKSRAASVYDRLKFSNLQDKAVQNEILDIINREHILDWVPILLGRQPTLHKHGIQGFHVEMTESSAIEVNPLVCVAYNMDFDGDQGYVQVPLSDASIREIEELVITTQHIFLPKNGECTLEPRQDMLYGLYVCTRNHYKVDEKVPVVYNSYEACKKDVLNHLIKVWDSVAILDTGEIMTAGDAAFLACFPKGAVLARGSSTNLGKPIVTEITNKNISDYTNCMLVQNVNGEFVYKIGKQYAPVDTFVGCINRLVELGFKVARLYPPNMSLIEARQSYTENQQELRNANAELLQWIGAKKPNVGADGLLNLTPEEEISLMTIVSKLHLKSIPTLNTISDVEKLLMFDIDAFYASMEEVEMYYGLGMETTDRYKMLFAEKVNVFMDSSTSTVISNLGANNGFVHLSKSGARGSESNLCQAFSVKGQVKKNSTESFDAILVHSYAQQMTPMEHNVAAYGGRQGQIDKSLKTGDTGYAMRQMWHATNNIFITEEDCGTLKGIKISKKDLVVFSTKTSEKDITAEVNEMFAHAINGRYVVGTNQLITEPMANKMAEDPKVSEVTIRSPLTCKNPCCVKCYGLSWSTRQPAVVGAAAGFVGAQSIGEPGTQLTLKTFQTGGVVGKGTVTSAFDRVNHYIQMHNLKDLCAHGFYPGYDPVAWADGRVIVKPTSKLNIVNVSIEGASKTIKMPKGTVFKMYAEKGKGLSEVTGDFNVSEVLEISGIEAAQLYLVFKLFSLYKKEAKIKMIHFECLVAGMTRYMILETDRSDLMVGQYATAAHLFSKNTEGTRYIPRLISVNALPNCSHDAVDAFAMEEIGEGLSRICALNMTDSLTKPLSRMIFAKSIIGGSAIPGYVQNRKMPI